MKWKEKGICKSGENLKKKAKLPQEHFVPRTIEEAERFCQEVTG